mmetsp:Transcript_59705/g.139711  ORF Transcript_59705/g.139711 Transcript_59705/m.139711 type:complete len:118 (+) Transcript_59705:24-377(+)
MQLQISSRPARNQQRSTFCGGRPVGCVGAGVWRSRTHSEEVQAAAVCAGALVWLKATAKHEKPSSCRTRSTSPNAILNRRLAGLGPDGILQLVSRSLNEFNAINLSTALFRLAKGQR